MPVLRTPIAADRVPLVADRASLVMVAIAAVLLAARLPLVWMPALWIDEAFSLYHARLSLGHLWTEGWRLESSPPLYYSALWAWIRLTTDSEVSGRLFSLLLTVLTSWFVFRTASTLAGRRAGAVAVLVFTLTGIGIEYSVEIRPYALQLCLISIALASFAVLAVRVSGKARPGAELTLHRPRGSDIDSRVSHTGFNAQPRNSYAGPYLILLCACIATFYAHTTSASFMAGLAAAGLYLGIGLRAGRDYFRPWFAACTVVALACLPQLFMAAGVLGSNRAGLAWIPKTLDLVNLSQIARHWALGAVYWESEISGPLALLVFVPIALSAWRFWRNPLMTAIGVAMPVTGIAVLLVAGTVQPVLLPRTALWLWVPTVVALGCCAAAVDWRHWGWRVAAGAIVSVSLVTGVTYTTLRKGQRPWHATIVKLSEQTRPGDRILVIDPEVACVLDHYAPAALRALPRLRLDLGSSQQFRSGQRLDIGCNRLAVVKAADVGSASERGDWIVVDAFLQRRDLANFLRDFSATVRSAETLHVSGQAHAARVVRNSKP